MSTHRRAWMIRAGVVVVAAAAGLVGIASPAFAAPVAQLSNVTVQPATISPGQQTTVSFSVKNTGDDGPITIEVTSSNSKVTCATTCKHGLDPFKAGETKSYTAKFAASGQFSATETVQLTIKAGSAQDTQQVTINVAQQQQPPPAAAGVTEVSGTVVDAFTNNPIEAAKVFMQDSAPKTWEVGTDSKGSFKITSRSDKPIAAGTLSFKIEKDGIEPLTTTKTGTAGQALGGLRFAVKTIASSGPAASAVGPVETPNASTETSADSASANEEESSLSWVLIAVGGVLVLLGIGAIVLLFIRKRDDGDGEDDPDSRKGGPPGGQPPGGRGGPRPMGPPRRDGPMRGPGGPGPGQDPTRQMRPPVSPGPRTEQTMIAPSPLANAQTQMYRQPVEPTDPYGRQNGGQPGPSYGGGPGAYGQPPQPGYGAPPSAYPGGPPPSYGQPDSYGQPYGQGGYGQPQSQPQGQPPGYGQPQDPYGQQNYGGPPKGGYDDGYPPQQGGGPDSRGPRPGQPPQDGRRVDWLDD